MTTDPYAGAFLKSFFPILTGLWFLWVVIGLLVAGRITLGIYRRVRIARSGLNDIDGMNGYDFERYLAFLFGRLGFRVQRTGSQGDFGADLVASGKGKRIVVQAKRHRRSVGVRAIQEAVAAKGWYSCDEAMVVTNSLFTAQAVRLARRNHVSLWDRNRLAKAMASVGGRRALAHAVDDEASARSTSSESAHPSGPTVAVCALCGQRVSERVRDYCVANAHRFDGRILCYGHQRARGSEREPF